MSNGPVADKIYSVLDYDKDVLGNDVPKDSLVYKLAEFAIKWHSESENEKFISDFLKDEDIDPSEIFADFELHEDDDDVEEDVEEVDCADDECDVDDTTTEEDELCECDDSIEECVSTLDKFSKIYKEICECSKTGKVKETVKTSPSTTAKKAKEIIKEDDENCSSEDKEIIRKVIRKNIHNIK